MPIYNILKNIKWAGLIRDGLLKRLPLKFVKENYKGKCDI